mgnify:CR=1 FL=1
MLRIGDGGAPAGPENEGLALVGAQHHLRILRHNAQQGQAGGVHGVINGGVKAAEQPGLYPVDHQMDAGDAVPEHRNRALGVPQAEASVVETTMARSAAQQARRNPSPSPAGESIRM